MKAIQIELLYQYKKDRGPTTVISRIDRNLTNKQNVYSACNNSQNPKEIPKVLE